MMDGSSTQHDGQADMARAEEMVDSMGQAIAGFASRISLEVMRGVALAREEAEDIWAEAQSLAHSQQR